MKTTAKTFFALILVFVLDSTLLFGQTPRITSISPTVGPVSPVGSSVTIKGSGFGSSPNGSTVTFAGTASTSSSWSDTKIVAPVPASLPVGFADVVVTVSSASSNTQSFLVIPTTYIVSPASGVVGTSVTIPGTSFGDQQGGSTISFGGVPTTPVSWRNTSISAPVPNTSGLVPIIVTVNGFTTNGSYFIVLPNITSLAPSAAKGGSLVTITGTALGSTQGFGGVTFNGISAQVQSWSNTSITAVVPSGATTGNVAVTTSALVTSSGVNFTVQVPPTLHAYLQNATLLNNGTVLMAGGINCQAADNCSFLNSAQIYDPGSDTFKSTGNLATARAAPAVLLANGQVLIAGGYSCDSNGFCASLRSVEIYDPNSGTFSSAGNMTVDRYGHTMTVLNNGKVLIAGGQSCTPANSCTALSTAEIYDPVAGTFSPSIGTLAFARFGAAATRLSDGKVLIVGGHDGTNFPATGEIYFPNSDFFGLTSNDLAAPRYQATATLLNNGKVLITGGSTCAAPGCPTNSAELFDESIGRFSSVSNNLNAARLNHTATLLNNGQVLIAGGDSSCGSSCTSDASTELYDSVAGTFTSSQTLAFARAGHSATLLQNGNVLFVGGINAGVTQSSNESYQPTSLTPSSLVSIAITPTNRSFLPGVILQLTATGTFSPGGPQTLQSMTWSSSDNTITTVTGDASNRGQAYAVANGPVTIRACAGSLCGSSTLTVGPATVTSITLTPGSAAVPLGVPQKFAAMATLSDGTTQDATSTVSWNSTSPSVATVNSIGQTKTLSTGSTTIQASLNSVQSSATLTVQPPVLVGLVLQPSLGGTTVGGMQQFTATGTYSDGSTQNLTGSAQWRSSATSVATIAAGGLSTGAGLGSATILATIGGATATASLKVAGANTPPGITALPSPAPNANGWNNTNVTVTFKCNAGSAAIVNCPTPQIVSSEGAGQIVSGSVTDAAGDTVAASLTLNIDKTRPVISVTAPSEGDGFSVPTITVAGSVSDALSGLAALNCNDTPGTVTSGSFSCNVSLNPGVNVVRVRASDIAGNITGSNFHVVLSASLPTPASIHITPTNVNMLMGDPQPFSVFDDQGRQRPDVTWSVSDSTIGALPSDAPGILVGIAPGAVMLTANVQGVNASTNANVMASFPPGTLLWSLPGSGKPTLAKPMPGAPDFYTFQEGTGNVTVTAFTIQGQQLWTTQVTGSPFFMNTVPDNNGGILLDFGGPGTGKIVDLDAQTGTKLWEYQHQSAVDRPGLFGRQLAVGQDGTVYTREVASTQNPDFPGQTDFERRLVALDGAAGTPTTLYAVPSSTLTELAVCGGVTSTILHPFTSSLISNPTIGPDGTVFASTKVVKETRGSCGNGDPTLDPGIAISLVTVQGGSATTAPLQTISAVDSSNVAPSAALFDIIPDGQGGAFAAWGFEFFRSQQSEMHISHGSTDIKVPLEYDDVTMVLGDQNTLFAASSVKVAAMSLSGSPKWTWTVPRTALNGLQLIGATAGGGLVVKTNDGTTDSILRFDGSGTPTTDTWTATAAANFGSGLNDSQLVAGDAWMSTISDGSAMMIASNVSLDWAATLYAAPEPSRSSVPEITLKVYSIYNADGVTANTDANIGSRVNNMMTFWQNQSEKIRFSWDAAINKENCCSGPAGSDLYQPLVNRDGSDLLTRFCDPGLPAAAAKCKPKGSQLLFNGVIKQLGAGGFIIEAHGFVPVTTKGEYLNIALLAADGIEGTDFSSEHAVSHEMGHQFQLGHQTPDIEVIIDKLLLDPILVVNPNNLMCTTGAPLVCNARGGLHPWQIRVAEKAAAVWAGKP